MAICRIEKTEDYTVMSNYHLKDKNLSLKAIGLLSKMLSLPNDWDFTIGGLESICKDGQACIIATVRELEKAHYIKRERTRNDKGVINGIEYLVYEIPYDIDRNQLVTHESVDASVSLPLTENPSAERSSMDSPLTGKTPTENPHMENPHMGNQQMENPHMENPSQSSTYKSTTKQSNTNTQSTNQSIYHNTDNKSNRAKGTAIESKVPDDGLMEMLKSRINYNAYETENDLLLQQLEEDKLSLDEFNSRSNHIKMINLILSDVCDIYSSSDDEVNIGKRTVSRQAFIAKFERLGHADIKKIANLVYEHNPKNRKLYTLAVIFNY